MADEAAGAAPDQSPPAPAEPAAAPRQADFDDTQDLEALADEIESEAQQPTVGELWEQATDANSGKPYWFNRALGESRWDPPPGWAPGAGAWHGAAGAEAAWPVPPDGGAQQQQQQQQQPRGPGYYYQDVYGVEQGPFTKEQLLQWRALLPMDLVVWYSEGSSGGDGPAAAPAEQASTAPAAVPPARRQAALELAVLLGDGALLARWRDDNPAQAGDAALPVPTAAAYEADVGTAGGASHYAAAALAGLPPDDEAVQLARAATTAGKSIQEVLAWNYRGGDYTSTVMHSRGRGRIQAAGGAGEGLYAEMGSWADPATLEAQLQKAAERRKHVPGPEEVRALRAKRAEMKEKKRRAWLMDGPQQ